LPQDVLKAEARGRPASRLLLFTQSDESLAATSFWQKQRLAPTPLAQAILNKLTAVPPESAEYPTLITAYPD
jgi:hypothetical protein